MLGTINFFSAGSAKSYRGSPVEIPQFPVPWMTFQRLHQYILIISVVPAAAGVAGLRIVAWSAAVPRFMVEPEEQQGISDEGFTRNL